MATYIRILTYPSGRKKKMTLTSGGRVVKVEPVPNKAKKTRTAKRLARRRRRIY